MKRYNDGRGFGHVDGRGFGDVGEASGTLKGIIMRRYLIVARFLPPAIARTYRCMNNENTTIWVVP